MIKKDLVEKVSEKTGLPKESVLNVVERTLEVIAEEVSEGGKVTIKGFGTFEEITKQERKGYNPFTKQPMVIPETKTVRFKPSEVFKSILK